MPENQWEVAEPCLGQGKTCGMILRQLPEWFGIPEEIEKYERETPALPTIVATLDGKAVGFLAIKQHNNWCSELYVLGVLPQHHHQGIGRAMIAKAEAYCRKKGVEYIQVKTLGASNPDEHYAKTRAFYISLGYRPMEEFSTIWDEANPCLILIKCIQNHQEV